MFPINSHSTVSTALIDHFTFKCDITPTQNDVDLVYTKGWVEGHVSLQKQVICSSRWFKATINAGKQKNQSNQFSSSYKFAIKVFHKLVGDVSPPQLLLLMWKQIK